VLRSPQIISCILLSSATLLHSLQTTDHSLQLPECLPGLFRRGVIMKFNDHHRSCVVMLSEAKHLRAPRARPFAEFTLSEANGLSMTTVWITDIMTLFTLIVSTGSKPLRGHLNHHVTMMGN
jgi:hypothetical protein